jgi:propanol-preferring alcohol dehydrogenase
VVQVARYQNRKVYAFTRGGDTTSQQFAKDLGVVWAGASGEKPPVELDAAIIFAPAGELVPLTLKLVRRGGRVVCAGIHMSDIPSFPYEDLWGERTVCSVANLTRRDGETFLPFAARIPVITEVQTYDLADVTGCWTIYATGGSTVQPWSPCNGYGRSCEHCRLGGLKKITQGHRGAEFS